MKIMVEKKDMILGFLYSSHGIYEENKMEHDDDYGPGYEYKLRSKGFELTMKEFKVLTNIYSTDGLTFFDPKYIGLGKNIHRNMEFVRQMEHDGLIVFGELPVNEAWREPGQRHMSKAFGFAPLVIERFENYLVHKYAKGAA